MSKLIFLDIDGTIVMPERPPSEATNLAIRAARSNGHKVFLSTGRMEAYVDETIKSIGFDGGIYSAGGQIVLGEKLILNHPMSAWLTRQIIDVLEEENVPFMLETSRGIFTGDGKLLQSIEELKQAYIGDDKDFTPNVVQCNPALSSSASYDDALVYKILLQAAGSIQAADITRKLGAKAKVVFFAKLRPDSPRIPGEISDSHFHKGAALQYVCQYLNADPGDCIAFGDSMNDAEILQVAGLGIAMGNGDVRIKELADQVCESCEDDGVAKMLARLGLI